MVPDSPDKDAGVVKSILQALNRIIWGKPRIPKPRDYPQIVTPKDRQRPMSWGTQADGSRKYGANPVNINPPLHVLRRSQEMQKIYAELIRISAERENRYKDYEDMILDPTISGAIELMTDDACQFNRERSATVWIRTEDSKIRKAGEELLDILQIEERIWDWTFNIALYGDWFVQPFATEGLGINAVQDDWHPADVQRLDVNGALMGFRTPRSDVETTQGIYDNEDIFWEPWQFVHFRIQASQRRRREIERQRMMPSSRFDKDIYRMTTRYGVSVIEATRRIYKQLQMVEQSLIISRMTRALLKYVYKVQCGAQNDPKSAAETVLAMKDLLTQQIGIRMGETYESTFNPMSGSEDVFIPVFGERGDVTIDKLGGEVDVRAIVDVDYLRKKLFGGLKVPAAFLGFECFRGDTKIRLLDGSTPTIKEVSENIDEYRGKHVFTCASDGKITTSPISHAQVTRRDATYVRVHLDNSKYVDVTPDHPMMMRDGSFKKASELLVNDSLMPLYTEVSGKGAYKGYRMVKQNTKPGGWKPVYRISAESHAGHPIPSGYMVHHDDENKLNDEGNKTGTYNHKVVRVEKLDIVEDAYDLGVEHENHTFALDAGVFVHNSDLPGAMGESALVRLEIQYARSVKRIQRSVIQGITRLMQIHLAYKHINPDPKRFAVEMEVISTAEEEERKNSLTSAIAVASSLTGLNKEMGIKMPTKEYAKLVYGEMLSLSGKFMDLIERATELPTEEEMAAVGDMGGMPGGMPGGEDLDLPPGEEPEEPAPEDETEPTLDVPTSPADEQPEGVLPSQGIAASTKPRGKVGKIMEEAGIRNQAKRAAMESVTKFVRQSMDMSSAVPRFNDKNLIVEDTSIRKMLESEDKKAMLKKFARAEKEEHAAEVERKQKVLESLITDIVQASREVTYDPAAAEKTREMIDSLDPDTLDPVAK
jgi:hypothetical protein